MGHRNSPVDLSVNDRRKKKDQRKEFSHLKVIKKELRDREHVALLHSLRSLGGMKKELVRWEDIQVDNNISKLCCFISVAIMIAMMLLTQHQQLLHGFHRTLLPSRAHTPGFELAGAFPVIYYQKRVTAVQRIVPQTDLPPCLSRAVEFNPAPSYWISPLCLA